MFAYMTSVNAIRHNKFTSTSNQREAPAVFLGYQEHPTGEPIPLWNMTEDVPEHQLVRGSTVSERDLIRAGFRIPLKPSDRLWGCPWCGLQPEIFPMRYRNTGRLFGWRLCCQTCGYEKSNRPAGWPQGQEMEAMENALDELVSWWNSRV